MVVTLQIAVFRSPKRLC